MTDNLRSQEFEKKLRQLFKEYDAHMHIYGNKICIYSLDDHDLDGQIIEEGITISIDHSYPPTE
ncbi:hypothetical protein HF639_16440 [Acidithiobacillus ferridurans]|nr:hypothetical protein [Acidithiobacillus ferridurans]MBU2728153.1 hypothetical protein [Acidithiobacillus ferridurans]